MEAGGGVFCTLGALGLFATVACKSSEEEKPAPLETASPIAPGAANIERFTDELLRAAPAGSSIGVFPLVFDDPSAEPVIPRLGVTTAESIAAELVNKGFAGAVLAPSEVSLFLSDLNVPQNKVLSLQAIVGEGDRLGMDIIVFGTIAKPNTVGVGRNPLRFEIEAFDVLRRRMVGKKERFDLENKSVNKDAFREVAEVTSWTVAKELAAENAGSLEKEISAALRVLARRIARLSDVPSIAADKRVYVAPADSSRFVSAIAELRTMQKSLWSEVAERERETPAPGDPDPMDRPLVMNQVQYADVQQARDFLLAFQESLQAKDSFRIGQQVTSNLVEELRPWMNQRQVFCDLGAVGLAEFDRVDGELATGGLAGSATVREMLKREGIAAVIQPRFERLGDQFSLRVEIYDLENPNVPLSTHVRIDRSYSQELAALLEVRTENGQIAEQLVPLEERQGWAPVKERVESGVVRLIGLDDANQELGHGTGFVVGPGVVMTNSHVLHGIQEAARQAVELSSGKVVSLPALSVLADDEFLDVAVLRVEGLPSELHVFEFAAPERARVGVDVAVLGHPKETIGQVFTAGILSSTQQVVSTTGSQTRPSYMYTCATRGGNSGSPVILLDGTVVAVNSHGKRSVVEAVSATGESTAARGTEGTLVTELPGFALGAPGSEARRVLEAALKK